MQEKAGGSAFDQNRKGILFEGGQKKSRGAGQYGIASTIAEAVGLLTLLNHKSDDVLNFLYRDYAHCFKGWQTHMGVKAIPH
jgi:hypothetical protein